jgi:hypothetical protein
MNSTHELPVVGAGSPRPAASPNRDPETPPPAGEQAVTFSQALDQFRQLHGRDFNAAWAGCGDALALETCDEARAREALRLWP